MEDYPLFEQDGPTEELTEPDIADILRITESMGNNQQPTKEFEDVIKAAGQIANNAEHDQVLESTRKVAQAVGTFRDSLMRFGIPEGELLNNLVVNHHALIFHAAAQFQAMTMQRGHEENG